MGVYLEQNSKHVVIEMCDMQDGQIAIVAEGEMYAGTIVQKHGDRGVAIGKPSGKGWSNIDKVTLKVRILEEGEKIVII